MIQSEYLRFLQTLNMGNAPVDVRKIANLVLIRMDELMPLNTYQGKRVKRIVELAQAQWDELSTEIPTLNEQPHSSTSSIIQLKRLSVGPFRGFVKQEIFDLAQLVLIYGPNGTGKSSFCEALEFVLLGDVAEAENRRFQDQTEYLKNAHVNKFVKPGILGTNEDGEEVSVTANEALYRFCFVEKNRIDSFSRIAAQTPAKQTELISTLFGLDSFTEFVRNFTAEIDNKYIDLIGIKTQELEQKRQTLAGAHQQIATNSEELKKINSEEETIARQYRQGYTFSQMIAELNGNEQSPGTIQRLEKELQKPLEGKSDLTIATLQNLGNLINANLAEQNAKQQELVSVSQQISFKHLYEAITELQSSDPDYCPACKTPLNQVAINPYTHASEELQKLQHLAVLQQTVQQLEKNIIQCLFDLSHIVNTCIAFLDNNILQDFQVKQGTPIDIAWYNVLNVPLQDGSTPWQHLHSQINCLEEKDNAIEQATQNRAVQEKDLDRLLEFRLKVIRLQEQRNATQKAMTTAKEIIANFNTENAQLILEAESEKVDITRNKAIATSYRNFVSRLNAYKDQLPVQLVANLGDMVVDLYNKFNREDPSDELLAAIKLPLAQNQRLKIAFNNDPQKFHDALHILSEGHIRCMGLAILLAKNIKENCPLLIFDDPVNAIDDGHRGSIRRTLFKDQYFSNKQIILTCHGEEFLKDIQNMFPGQAAEKSKLFGLLPRLDGPHIYIDFNCASRNYIIAARTHFCKIEIGDALSKCRKALESLAKSKVWNYVSKHGDGNLSIKLRSAKAPIELRNLMEQLGKQISNPKFRDLNKNSVFDPINRLLSINGESPEWRYLNKGAHEESDRAEFERETVSEIIEAIENLDTAIHPSQIALAR